MSIRIMTGDCLDVLRTLPDASVNCCVTSPPYYGLRDYGTATWEGGDAECDHIMPVSYKSSTLGASTGGRSEETHARSVGAQAKPYAKKCGKCGARRIDNQIGLEETPEAYVSRLVEVFREVRRVLADDGTLWLNIGDSYAGSWSGNSMRPDGGSQRPGDPGFQPISDGRYAPRGGKTFGLKPKDLIGIPWMLAFALRADGWYLRQDIIWHKPNPMPESVRDRCTKSHEYLFLLAKSSRYFYDADAVSEESTGQQGAAAAFYRKSGRLHRNLGADRTGGNEFEDRERTDDGTRNRRSVWSIPTQPFAEAHFATMAPELAETCIKAGCPKGGTVLDPFGGAGTTALCADRLGRNALLIELNPAYVEIASKRLTNDAGLFAEVA